METTKKQLVNFHIGRGGRFHNQGHLTFVSVRLKTKEIIEDDTLLLNEDETAYTDHSGNHIADLNDETHEYCYNFDNDYDTSYGIMVESFGDLSDREKEAVLDAQNNWEFGHSFGLDFDNRFEIRNEKNEVLKSDSTLDYAENEMEHMNNDEDENYGELHIYDAILKEVI